MVERSPMPGLVASIDWQAQCLYISTTRRSTMRVYSITVDNLNGKGTQETIAVLPSGLPHLEICKVAGNMLAALDAAWEAYADF